MLSQFIDWCKKNMVWLLMCEANRGVDAAFLSIFFPSNTHQINQVDAYMISAKGPFENIWVSLRQYIFLFTFVRLIYIYFRCYMLT